MLWSLSVEIFKNTDMAPYLLMETLNSSGELLFGESIRGPLNC